MYDHESLSIPPQIATSINQVLSNSESSFSPSPPSSSSAAVAMVGAPPSSSAPASTPNANHFGVLQQATLESQIDQLFPNPESLLPYHIDAVQANLRQEIQQCQRRIEQLVQQLERQVDTASMSDIQEAISSLLNQLNLIREKARESENVVKEITSDIRSLDTAKGNVVSSMTALKRLQMLVNGTDQLQRLAETRRYREAASSLQAVKSLLESFSGYKGVERIALVWKQVNSLQANLRTAVMNDFEHFFLHDPGRPVKATSLPDAALVLDALGSDAKSSLIDWYCALQLREYRRIFRATDEAGQLDNVSRRFAWFRRVLKVHEEEHQSAFVPGWHVDRWLIRRFGEITREDLKSVLIRQQGKIQVSVLLEALNATLEFEGFVSRKYGIPFEEVIASPAPPSTNQTAAGPSQPRSSASTATAPLTNNSSAQSLSTTFDPYLTIFVEAQDKVLSDMMSQYRRQGPMGSTQPQDEQERGDQGASATSSHVVLPSSTELFFFYRQALEQCARLSNREPFKELYEVYRKYLRVYADEVLRSALMRNEQPRRSLDVRPNVSEIQKWCLVLNTADYCATTAGQLEDKIKEKIHPDFKRGISFEEEKSIFVGIISAGITVLTRELELCSESPLNQMIRPPVPWSQVKQVTGKSAYVDDFSSVLEQIAVVIRQEVENKRFVRSWCDKVVGSISSKLTLNLVRLKPISRSTAEQLLLDVLDIKSTLLDLPRFHSDDALLSTAATTTTSTNTLSNPNSLNGSSSTTNAAATSTVAASYKRYVTKTFYRLETLLKVIMTSDQDAEEMVKGYLNLVGDRSYSNFQKVLDFKGIRKVDQNHFLDTFLSLSADWKDGELEDSSFLTSLDMDPSSYHPTPSPFDNPTSQFNTFFNQSLNLQNFGGGGGNLNGGGFEGGGSSYLSEVSRTNGGDQQQQQSPQQFGAGSRALSDLKRFGSMFGVALGRKENDGRR
ncbi:hypothetical protein IE53DRAFT_389841 [Violaceomyces palustris]|uniref:Uncharacterized protein n=1 Tax=Violaceomyces palustris TaxID=1673888 RepID=A0ACD0NQ96_9BASI|nr:hypothetical protein IE53DRAFT_389841 [Violaceomyces palustris]